MAKSDRPVLGHHIATLQRRLRHLRKRVEGDDMPDKIRAFDLAEIAALEAAVRTMQEVADGANP